MTLPRKPPLKQDWGLANWEKRVSWCRVCRRSDRRIELAHVIGVEHDTREAKVEKRAGKQVRVVYINPDRVIPLCGPSTDPASCHGKQHASRLDIRDFLTDREWRQAITDAGSLGQAMRKCAPLTRDQRTDFNEEGELIEVEFNSEQEVSGGQAPSVDLSSPAPAGLGAAVEAACEATHANAHPEAVRRTVLAARPYLEKAERERMAREILCDLISHNEYGECQTAPGLVTKLRAEFPHLAEFPSRAVVNNTTEGED